ncbi:MAG: hypothetical protein GY810_12005, partial [Aureispira sp.]|nr:hypothetical protein [Aureispira sp.]
MKIIQLLVFLLFSVAAMAQPANNDCFGAQAVVDDGTCVAGTTVAATDSWTNLVGCQGGNPNADHEDVWYSFTATNATFSVDITAGAGWAGDLEFTIWEDPLLGCLGPFTLVADGCGGSPLNVTATLIPGNTYYMVVSNHQNGTPGAFSICPETTAPPVGCVDNNDCSTAANIVLPVSGDPGAQVCITDCNTGASAGVPGLGVGDCYESPNATVWYQFTTGPAAATLDIDLTSTDLDEPEFTVWTNCPTANYIGASCTEGTGGVANLTGLAVAPSTTYWLAVSDVGGDQGSFDLCLNQNIDVSLCNIGDVLAETSSSDPSTPIGGPYSAGEVVDFCYTINEYRKENCNWLQGIVPTFGDCWDPSSFNASGMPVVTTALTQQGSSAGTWQWWPTNTIFYNNLGASGSLPAGANVGAGWFFNCTGCGFGVSGANPNNTYGDGDAPGLGQCDVTGNGYTWTVCFQLTAGPASNCTNGTVDCGIDIKTYADAELGVYTSIGCAGDTPFEYDADYLCCVGVSLNTATDPQCNGESNGAIDVNIVGANMLAYTYLWSSGQTTEDLSNISAGSYTITVTDPVNVCQDTMTVVITDPSVVTASIPSSSSVTCNGGTDGTATALGAGGTGAHTYLWSSGSQTTATATGLANGSYTVTVSDANSCTATATVSITEPSIVTASIPSSSSVTCNGGTDGTATALGTGGSGSYTYLWSSGGQTTATATGLGNGSYTVTVSDGNTCTATAVVSITEPSAVTASIPSSSSVTCNGGTDGTATALGTGGTGAHTYLWSSGGQTTATATGLANGSYTVTVSDANSCTA